MTGSDIRRRFVSFFERHGHRPVASSGLVPRHDPTLLFTNAGMVQFKNLFLGQERRDYTRAVTVQKCVRAGGKHNDLENVGRTPRHHTFFEMLGNFSFGDYFKADAIPLAWQFVTGKLGIPPERLLVTVYAEDDEAWQLWREKVGLPSDKIIRIGTSDNFWSMGETGPCGPCSEIFYDYGPEVAGGPPGSPDGDGNRFVEIWNLVFMQFNRDAGGHLTPLPSPCIDTGAGLERMAAVVQGCTSNFDTDLFQPLLRAAAARCGIDYATCSETERISLRVIADHVRAAGFLIADGVLPANEGRGYVLRRIMRRAMRHGRMLGLERPFLHALTGTLAQTMGETYPELVAQGATVAMVVENEEKRFATTLGSGLKLLDQSLTGLTAGGVLDGEAVFTLYDTYGFPTDLTADIARDRGITLDMDGFNDRMNAQKKRARASWSGSGDLRVAGLYHELLESCAATEFLGYDADSAQGMLQAIMLDGVRAERVVADQEAQIVVNQTPFYGESGGQVGDTGVITARNGRFEVLNTQKPLPGLFVHHGRMLQGALAVGDDLTLEVNAKRRNIIRLHHSATHLLQHALRQVLGGHVKQAGSMVSAERLRLDFSHFQAMTPEEIDRVEDMVNAAIWANDPQRTTVMTPEEAVAIGAMALFGEKYGESVRVVRIGESLELCGGTHVAQSGEIGVMRIVAESAVAAGVRRIEAVCGPVARRSFVQDGEELKKVARLLKVGVSQVVEGVEKLLARQRELERHLEKAKSAMSGNIVDDLLGQVRTVAGFPLLVARVEGVDPKGLRDLCDRLKEKLPSAVILLGVAAEGKVSVLAGVTSDLTAKIKAGDLVRFVSERVGGKGGGRPDMAQGGGTRPEQLNEALAALPAWIENKEK
ncbi:MAG: alanine--tRNA ligase [Magnetococcales bacterium]|nr:alanine--tRNA ligase [Magnetococcales bacterium]MBF0322531.1 alanine--tRNA ligase [Magnetococcales bacterium]